MGDPIKGGCKNRLLTGVYMKIYCSMPCASTNAQVKRAIYNELKGTELACPVKDMYISRPLGTDPDEMLDKPTGSCNFGWGCSRSITRTTRKTTLTKQTAGQWLKLVRILLMPIKSALDFLFTNP